MKCIELTQGQVAIVDDEDFANLAQYRWRYHGAGYARRTSKKAEGPLRTVFMHREIMSAPSGFDVDHINGNGLDNRRCNLRVCTTRQNIQNQKLSTRNTTGLKGVRKEGKKFGAQIKLADRRIYLGSFKTAEEAHHAYCEAARKHYGEFARFN